jgi:hypothetical protein
VSLSLDMPFFLFPFSLLFSSFFFFSNNAGININGGRWSKDSC